jgi:hypothetical protein
MMSRVGRALTIGDVRCRGLRLAEPCAHLERLAGSGLLRPLIHRGGLRADISSGSSESAPRSPPSRHHQPPDGLTR